MSTEHKETHLYKILLDMSNERPVTAMSLKAAVLLATWDGQEIPPEIRTLIQGMANE